MHQPVRGTSAPPGRRALVAESRTTLVRGGRRQGRRGIDVNGNCSYFAIGYVMLEPVRKCNRWEA
ncbi:hypothetical protein Rrhod_2730 [Rhodococcus rhodnii LMG 5362]|uniref:Uncharacterized protein n=1 Tax=Rhodococcus rhodnii LMG 5362 TaxID=1273125 RepID=R7WPD6_9NOCA|nr:hypothetical protein Rrhod_2730 [Rhodococcus rhodnii LMG 5362]